MMQAHLASGISFSEIIQKLRAKTFNDVLKDLHSLTGKTYKDSFFYAMDQEMYRLLGVPDKVPELTALNEVESSVDSKN